MNYIIIGAMDGVSFDNIFERLTKDDVALFVEPIPHQFKKLQENVKELPCKVFLENTVISDRIEDIVMAYLPDDKIDAESYHLGGCSSIVKFGLPLNSYLGEINNLYYYETKSITFDMLCDKYGFDVVDYVQIDCEGYDQIIVDSIDINKYKIKQLKFEIHYVNNEFLQYFEQKTNPVNITNLNSDIIYEYTF
jgi:FkbM family methyltransferase